MRYGTPPVNSLALNTTGPSERTRNVSIFTLSPLISIRAGKFVGSKSAGSTYPNPNTPWKRVVVLLDVAPLDSDTFAASEEKFAKNRAGATATGAESDKSGQADFDSQHTENENERAMLSSSSTRVQNSMKIDIPQPQVLSMPSGSTPKMILENIVEAAQSDQFNRSVHISDTFSSVRELEVRLSRLAWARWILKCPFMGTA